MPYLLETIYQVGKGASMTQQTRRQFFKTIAATLAAGAAAVMASTVLAKEKLKHQWEDYYAGREDLNDPVFLEKLDVEAGSWNWYDGPVRTNLDKQNPKTS